jgi:hypothetical protein
MKMLRSGLAATLTTATLFSVTAAPAQDIQYQSVTKLEMPGAAGRAMRIAARLGGGSMETVETTSIKGRKMRTDVDKTSTIFDLDGKRFISLDHAAKTYSVFTFDEMIARARQAGEEMKREGRQVSGENDAEAHFNFRFAVDRGNDRQQIVGYDAERYFLTMEAEGEYRPEGAAEREKAGTLVVLTDMWTSRDVPVLQARSAFDDASARQYADAGAALMQGIAAAFADDPRMKVAFEQSVSEARKIEGMAVRTVTSFVSVAPGHKFDRAIMTESRPQGPSLAQQAGRAALGRVAGGLGRRQQQPEERSEPEVTQATIFTVTSEIRNVTSKTLDAQLFDVPAGYREVKLDH